MDNYERKTQDSYGRLLERQRELDRAIEGLELALSQNEIYQSLTKLKEEREHLYDNFKLECEKEFRKRGVKTVSGNYGRVTLVERTTYKIADESLVPEKYFSRAVDMNAVKKDIGLFHKDIPGIEAKTSYGMKLTPNREGESS